MSTLALSYSNNSSMMSSPMRTSNPTMSYPTNHPTIQFPLTSIQMMIYPTDSPMTQFPTMSKLTTSSLINSLRTCFPKADIPTTSYPTKYLTTSLPMTSTQLTPLHHLSNDEDPLIKCCRHCWTSTPTASAPTLCTCLPIYKMIPGIWDTPRQFQCVWNYIFPHLVID